MSDTGDRIKEKRKEKRLTQEQLGSLVRKSKQVVSNWERGYSKPVDEDLLVLSNALDASADYLLGNKIAGIKANNKIFDEKEEILNEAKELLVKRSIEDIRHITEIVRRIPEEKR